MGLNIFNPSSTSALRDKMYGNTNSGPSLDLQFAKYKSLEDYVTGKNLITFTRASTATYVDSNGIIQTAAVDTPRFDHDPVTGESLGLLIEEARTNLKTYSNDFTQQWAPISSSILSTNNPDPFGGLTAARIDLSGANSRLQINSTSATGISTFSVWMRLVSGNDQVRLLLQTSSGVDTGDTVTVTSEWQRFSTTQNVSSSGGIQIRNSTATPVVIEVYGSQVEEGSFPTSYIPTTSSTVTRATDLTSITGTNFSSWYNQSEGTAFAEYDGLKDYSRVLNLNTGKTLIVNRPIINSAYDGVTETASIADLGLTLGDTRKSVTAYSGTTTTLTINGRVPVTGSSDFTSTTNTVIYLGGQGNDANVLNGHISRLTYFPERLPDATLQAITS